MESVKIKDIKPAEYNPRKISEEAFEELKGSIRTFGFIIPIIVNKDNSTIVAGHQRTKAALVLGIEEVPAYFIEKVDIESEILFNQVHNGVELEPEKQARCKREVSLGYHKLPNKEFECHSKNASVAKDICRLLVRYGNVLSAIICNGKVVFGNNYVYAAQILGIDVNCYVLDEALKGDYDHYFSRNYGVYCYDHIERADFMQGRAQPPVCKAVEWSILYEHIVPRILKEDPRTVRVLDFGCGKARHIDKLRVKHGFKKTVGLEFFNHNRVGISVQKGHDLIDEFIAFIQKNGKFDYTICDAVVNSVNTQAAEENVFRCLNLFTQMGGVVYCSGRMLEVALKQYELRRNTSDSTSTVQFFDENGLTAIMQEGQWFFQKFLKREQVDGIFEKYGFAEPFMRYERSGYWGFGAYKVRELSTEEYVTAVDYEFNLNLPNGQTYNRHEEIKKLFNLI